VEQRQEDRDLRHDRQAAGQGVDAALLLQRHDGLAHALAVTAVLLPELLDLRLDLLHRALRLHLPDEQPEQQQADRDDQERDRQRPGDAARRVQEGGEQCMPLPQHP